MGIDVRDMGLSLHWPLEWEMHNFKTPTYIWPQLKQLDVPSIGIYGKPDFFMPVKTQKKWKQNAPTTKFIYFSDNGHLLPLENGEACALGILKTLGL